jgi:hypothetical protein
MNTVSCPICSKPIRHWQPANIAKPGNVEERTLVIMFRCCGQGHMLAADFEVRVVPIRSANS